MSRTRGKSAGSGSRATNRRAGSTSASGSRLRTLLDQGASLIVAERSAVPEVDLAQSRDPERLQQLAAVIDIVAEEPLEHGTASVHPRVVPLRPLQNFVEHLQGPAVQAVLDDPER